VPEVAKEVAEVDRHEIPKLDPKPLEHLQVVVAVSP
jgi:hypothetical protein